MDITDLLTLNNSLEFNSFNYLQITDPSRPVGALNRSKPAQKARVLVKHLRGWADPTLSVFKWFILPSSWAQRHDRASPGKEGRWVEAEQPRAPLWWISFMGTSGQRMSGHVKEGLETESHFHTNRCPTKKREKPKLGWARKTMAISWKLRHPLNRVMFNHRVKNSK